MISIIESAKGVFKSTSKNRSEANKEFYSLSAVIRQIKTKTMWESGFGAAFASVGITNPNQLTPAILRNVSPEMCEKDKKGASYIGSWGYTAKKDEEGNKVLDKKGNPVMIPTLRRISSWSPNKLLQVLAQNAAIVELKRTIPTGKATPTTKKNVKKGAKKNAA